MKKKTINYITNIIGLAIIALAFYEYFDSKDWSWFIGLIVVGLSCFIISNDTLQGILKTIIGFKSTSKAFKQDIIEGPDPKKEEK